MTTPTDTSPAPDPTPAGFTWNTRPLFVSSTFADLHDESDCLRVHALAPLEERLRERRHSLETIDPRQGVETGAKRARAGAR